MLVAAVTFDQVVLAVHIVSVVIAFGTVIAYPFIALGAGRLDVRALPALHRSRQQIGRILVNPGLVLVLVSGIYLASEGHEWKQFYVQWGLAMVVILGGIEGALVMRQEGQLADLAEAEVTAGGLSTRLSAGYARLRSRSDWASRLMALLVIVTIYFMATQA